MEPSIVRSGRRPINSRHLRHISSWIAKRYVDHLTSPFRVENSGQLKPPMTTSKLIKGSYGQMMLYPEGRRHWSR